MEVPGASPQHGEAIGEALGYLFCNHRNGDFIYCLVNESRCHPTEETDESKYQIANFHDA